jgi:hypothetical protein
MAAASPASLKFVHRSNRNGTTDSICRECFATVATAIWEADLERSERAHACDPWTVERFKKLVKPGIRPVVLPWRAPV